MDSHEIREENSLLRIRLTQAEEKMRLLADALEARNQQINDISQMYNQLQEEFQYAQEAVDSSAKLLQERDDLIQQYSELIAQLQKDKTEKNQLDSEKAAQIRAGINEDRIKFLETLNKLGQTKTPSDEIIQEMENMLDKKAKDYAELSQKYSDLSKEFQALSESNEYRENEYQSLLKSNEDLELENRTLKQQIRELQSGKFFRKEIESMNIENERLRQTINQQRRTRKTLKTLQLQSQANLDSIKKDNDDKQALIDELIAKEATHKDEIRKYQQALDQMRVDKSKAIKNESIQTKKTIALEEKIQNLEEQLIMANEQIKALVDKASKTANSHVKYIKNEDIMKTKIQNIKKRAQEEISKRITAEEAVYAHKEENFKLKKEIALLHEELENIKSSDVEPLVQLLRDLRVETIEIDSDYKKLIESIPQSKPLKTNEIPQGICESSAAIIANVISQAEIIEIENKELRTIIKHIARLASEYHRIVSVISKYPILSIDDICLDEPYGNWVLPLDVVHLQKTVIKLHEIIVKNRTK
ncbi:hypothetical protein GPJ56_000847 [Histomonas meleagridis]|uniref:uncharacterized protein n=1 Tax=Histomonas meleagridis TaxID=135588 RepID=UPI003559FAB2|nr:hypothetical protein GPJ56_000847 [Histomonas meleagridis]KAH0801321.1 hypothetical protein GO595_005916 [Histomonas meleagridis]